MAAFQSPPAGMISYKNKWPSNRTKNKAPGTFARLQAWPTGSCPASRRLHSPKQAGVEEQRNQEFPWRRNKHRLSPGEQGALLNNQQRDITSAANSFVCWVLLPALEKVPQVQRLSRKKNRSRILFGGKCPKPPAALPLCEETLMNLN